MIYNISIPIIIESISVILAIFALFINISLMAKTKERLKRVAISMMIIIAIFLAAKITDILKIIYDIKYIEIINPSIGLLFILFILGMLFNINKIFSHILSKKKKKR